MRTLNHLRVDVPEYRTEVTGPCGYDHNGNASDRVRKCRFPRMIPTDRGLSQSAERNHRRKELANWTGFAPSPSWRSLCLTPHMSGSCGWAWISFSFSPV